MIRESIFEQLRRIPEELQEIHERLENWAAWSRDRIRQGHCRSIEFRYKSSEIWDDAEPRAMWNSLEADALHRHVCEIPEKSRWLLHLHYIHKAPEGYMRRKLGLHRDALVTEMHSAMRMVRNRART